MNLVYKKVQAVVSQFIDSAIPPALHITIPQEMAQRIRRCVPIAGPYLMKEAQVISRNYLNFIHYLLLLVVSQDTVFRILFTHWLDFCKWKGQHQAGELPFDQLQKEIHKDRRSSKSDGQTKWKPRSDSIFSRTSYDGRNDDNWIDDERGSKLMFTLSLYNETGNIYIVRSGKRGKVCKSIYNHEPLHDFFQSNVSHLPYLPEKSKPAMHQKTRFNVTDSI